MASEVLLLWGLFNSIGLGFFIYEKNNNGLRLVIHKICG